MFHVGRRFVPQSTIDRRVQAKDDRMARELAAFRTRTSNAALFPKVPPAAVTSPAIGLESLTISADALPHHYIARAVLVDLQPSQMVAALALVEAAIRVQHPHAVRTGWRACSDSLRVYFSAWSPSLTQ